MSQPSHEHGLNVDHTLLNDTNANSQVRDQLLKLARDLPYLANAKSKPVSVVLAEAKAKLQAIEDSLGGERQLFQWITAAELATGMFGLSEVRLRKEYRLSLRERTRFREAKGDILARTNRTVSPQSTALL